MLKQESPQNHARALLVHVELAANPQQEDLVEFKELVRSSGTLIMGCVTANRPAPDAKYFVGSGKVEEIAYAIGQNQADLVIFNNSLKPSQERNLETALKCRVIDRTTLILDIFAQRAQSFEGKLQVERAQLQHLSTRLVRGWTHLERQKGGIGLRGPGETQLETDRRLLGNRLKQIDKQLAKVRTQRSQSRRLRERSETPVIALVGYTNAGKSTLFNQLTGAGVYAADQLFATLDPTFRSITLPNSATQLVLVDTVGFIRHLPHDLVDAFHATLQETSNADLLLHILDASHPEREIHLQQVNAVLQAIEADAIPQILIYNKIDKMAMPIPPRVEYNAKGQPQAIWLSAQTQQGVAELIKVLSQYVHREHAHYIINLPPSAGKFRAYLFSVGHIVHEQLTEAGGWQIEMDLPKPLVAAIEEQAALAQCDIFR